MMQCDVSALPTRQLHLRQRLAAASAAGLISSECKTCGAARAFVPEIVECAALVELDPQTPLSQLAREIVPDERGWVARDDLFNEVARWLGATFSANEYAWLVCEAGSSEAGDKVLEQRPHILLKGRPYLRIKVGAA